MKSKTVSLRAVTAQLRAHGIKDLVIDQVHDRLAGVEKKISMPRDVSKRACSVAARKERVVLTWNKKTGDWRVFSFESYSSRIKNGVERAKIMHAPKVLKLKIRKAA